MALNDPISRLKIPQEAPADFLAWVGQNGLQTSAVMDKFLNTKQGQIVSFTNLKESLEKNIAEEKQILAAYLKAQNELDYLLAYYAKLEANKKETEDLNAQITLNNDLFDQTNLNIDSNTASEISPDQNPTEELPLETQLINIDIKIAEHLKKREELINEYCLLQEKFNICNTELEKLERVTSPRNLENNQDEAQKILERLSSQSTRINPGPLVSDTPIMVPASPSNTRTKSIDPPPPFESSQNIVTPRLVSKDDLYQQYAAHWEDCKSLLTSEAFKANPTIDAHPYLRDLIDLSTFLTTNTVAIELVTRPQVFETTKSQDPIATTNAVESIQEKFVENNSAIGRENIQESAQEWHDEEQIEEAEKAVKSNIGDYIIPPSKKLVFDAKEGVHCLVDENKNLEDLTLDEKNSAKDSAKTLLPNIRTFAISVIKGLQESFKEEADLNLKRQETNMVELAEATAEKELIINKLAKLNSKIAEAETDQLHSKPAEPTPTLPYVFQKLDELKPDPPSLTNQPELNEPEPGISALPSPPSPKPENSKSDAEIDAEERLNNSFKYS